jgi:hypothetical protein
MQHYFSLIQSYYVQIPGERSLGTFNLDILGDDVHVSLPSTSEVKMSSNLISMSLMCSNFNIPKECFLVNNYYLMESFIVRPHGLCPHWARASKSCSGSAPLLQFCLFLLLFFLFFPFWQLLPSIPRNAMTVDPLPV